MATSRYVAIASPRVGVLCSHNNYHWLQYGIFLTFHFCNGHRQKGYWSLKGHPSTYSTAAYLTLLLILSIALWLPRLEGPLDLRYDAGVYYILGSSLVEGKGYRLLNEPGEIEAIQYPPLLPLFAATHQLLAGTTDPAIAGHWLRLSYFVLYLAFVGSVFVLCRRYLSPLFAFLASLVTILNIDMIWLSELLHAELPFTLMTVVFLAFVKKEQGWPRNFLLGACAAGSLLLRSSGITLLGAWIAESLMRRRFRDVAIRTAIALIPLLLWQVHVAQVRTGPEYTQPTYEYQRAAYQFNNVGYLENLTLIDPFVPEKGTLTLNILLERIGHNLVRMPKRWGEMLFGHENWLRYYLSLIQNMFPFIPVPSWLADVLLTVLGLMVLGGLMRLVVMGELIIPLYVAFLVALLCLLPWPGQFHRYLVPLTPLFALAMFVALVDLGKYLSILTKGQVSCFGLIPAFLVACFLIGQEGYVVWNVGTMELKKDLTFVNDENGNLHTYRLFFYTPAWRQHDEALDWLKQEAKPTEVLATSTPHWAYLKTGLKAVLPPFESDVCKAQQLVDSVPVKYLVIDTGQPLIPSGKSSLSAGRSPIDLTQRYATQLATTFPNSWKLIYSKPKGWTKIYQRITLEKEEECNSY